MRVEGQVLRPDTCYEARLIPLLLHETFANMAIGQSAIGDGATLTGPAGGWIVADAGTNEGPSRWVVGEGGTPPTRHVEQQSNFWGGSDVASNPNNPGTILLRASDPMLAANHPDQPNNWTDYRFTAVLRAIDNDSLGVVFRYSGASDHYLVFDRIDAAADATRGFQLNSPLRPTIAGAGATFTGRMSTLTVDRILPAGTGATASVFDWSSDSDMGGGFRLDVTQTGAAGKSRFLHVLSLDGGATATAASDMGTQVGVDVTLRGGGHAVVRFESDGVGGSLRLTGPGGAVLEQATLAAGVAVLPVTP